MTSGSQARTRFKWALAGALLLLTILVIGVLDLRAAPAAEQPSRCHGSVNNGSLEHGWKLPRRGPNFSAYSTLGVDFGVRCRADSVR